MESTIASIATAPGMGAVGLIRVSGPEAFSLVSRCLAGKKDCAGFTERMAMLTRVVDAEDQTIDEILATCFHGPRSYTGEDTVELCLLYTSPSPRDGLLSRMPSSA